MSADVGHAVGAVPHWSAVRVAEEESKPAPAADGVEATPPVAQAAEQADEPDVAVPEAAAEADSDEGEQG